MKGFDCELRLLRAQRSLAMRPLWSVCCAVVLVACGGGSDSLTSQRDSDAAVAYQIDAAHSGVAKVSAPVFRLGASWVKVLEGQVSYPLIADGSVFVVVHGGSDTEPTRLHAFNTVTGTPIWQPVAIGGLYGWASHAYDQGQIFVVNRDGLLRAFDAVTGRQNWSRQVAPFGVTAAPTARDGLVYVGGSSAIYAVDQRTGDLRWNSAVAGGDQSSPAVASGGVFVAYPCQTYGFEPRTGSTLWHDDGRCVGGGGRTANLSAGIVYVRELGSASPVVSVRKASTGTVLSVSPPFSLGLPTALAVTPSAAYTVHGGMLHNLDPMLQVTRWTFGDGTLTAAPIVIDRHVVTATSTGRVIAVDVDTGQQTWNAELPAPILGDGELGTAVPSGLAAAQGFLLVPAGKTLSAWSLR